MVSAVSAFSFNPAYVDEREAKIFQLQWTDWGMGLEKLLVPVDLEKWLGLHRSRELLQDLRSKKMPQPSKIEGWGVRQAASQRKGQQSLNCEATCHPAIALSSIVTPRAFAFFALPVVVFAGAVVVAVGVSVPTAEAAAVCLGSPVVSGHLRRVVVVFVVPADTFVRDAVSPGLAAD